MFKHDLKTESKTDSLIFSKIANFKHVFMTYMLFFKRQILILLHSRKSKKDTEKKVKKQIMILKTLDPCLLDMELEKYIEINNLNINPISLFQEI